MAHLLLFGTSLTRCDSDDIVFTSLNPSQSFKTTILAGMNPNMINDICGRALGFWTYQVTQEANFQQMILRDAQERASVMEKKIDTLLREANSELASLREKVQGLQAELARTTKKNHDLAETNKKAAQDYMKLKGQYEKMVGKSVAANAGLNFGKSGYATVGSFDAGPQSNAGNQTIGMTPSRAFQPGPGLPSKRHSTDQLRHVNLIDGSAPPVRHGSRPPSMPTHRNNPAYTESILQQNRFPNQYTATDSICRPPNVDGGSRSGSSIDNTARFSMPMGAGGSSRLGNQIRRSINVQRA